MFLEALFTIDKIRKQPKCPSTNEWIKKMWCIYIYPHTHTMEYYSAIKKKKILPPFHAHNGILLSHKTEEKFCSNTDGLGGHYAK